MEVSLLTLLRLLICRKTRYVNDLRQLVVMLGCFRETNKVIVYDYSLLTLACLECPYHLWGGVSRHRQPFALCKIQINGHVLLEPIGKSESGEERRRLTVQWKRAHVGFLCRQCCCRGRRNRHCWRSDRVRVLLLLLLSVLCRSLILFLIGHRDCCYWCLGFSILRLFSLLICRRKESINGL